MQRSCIERCCDQIGRRRLKRRSTSRDLLAWPIGPLDVEYRKADDRQMHADPLTAEAIASGDNDAVRTILADVCRLTGVGFARSRA